jgi:hypothetical protein
LGNLEDDQEKKIKENQIECDLTPKTNMRVDKRVGHLEPLDWQSEKLKNCI